MSERQGQRQDTAQGMQQNRFNEANQLQQNRMNYANSAREDRQDFWDNRYPSWHGWGDWNNWGGYYAGLALGGFAIGATLASLPASYTTVYVGSSPYYYSGGVFYAPRQWADYAPERV